MSVVGVTQQNFGLFHPAALFSLLRRHLLPPRHNAFFFTAKTRENGHSFQWTWCQNDHDITDYVTHYIKSPKSYNGDRKNQFPYLERGVAAREAGRRSRMRPSDGAHIV